MQVFIPSKNRADTISTHNVFPKGFILVHDDIQRKAYISKGIDPERVIVTKTKPDEFGLTRQREWAVKNLVRDGEWFVFADDNILRLSWLPLPYYKSSEVTPESVSPKNPKELWGTECPWDTFRDVVAKDTITYAERVGARMCGFAVVDNFFFRSKKFRSIGYVIGKLMLMKKDRLTFDHTITMEDFRNTADHLLRFGAVAINNFAFPVAKHYQKGGMGSYKERVPFRQKDVKRLMFLYEGLLRVKNRDGFEPNTDLQVTIHNANALAEWRKKTSERWKTLSARSSNRAD